MTGFYCLPPPRIWRGERLRQLDEPAGVDPYGPASANLRGRSKVTHTEIAPGMVRVDIGEPIARPAGCPQPVAVEAPPEPAEPEASPAAASALPTIRDVLNATKVPRKVSSEPDWRRDYGLRKSD